MAEKSYHPVFGPERVTGFNGDWAIEDTLQEARKLSNGIEKLAGQYPKFDHRWQRRKVREQQEYFLLACTGQLSVMIDSLEKMKGLWLSYWKPSDAPGGGKGLHRSGQGASPPSGAVSDRHREDVPSDTAGTNLIKGDQTSAWFSAPKPDCAVRMAGTMTRAGLVMPPIPAHFYDRLLETERGWAWSTTPSITPFSMYDLPRWRDEGQPLAALGLEWALAESTSDFVAFAHAGHGINSYGLGFALRWGSLFVFTQVGWGGHMMPEWTTAFVNEVYVALARFLEKADLEGWTEPGPVENGFIFSDYRGAMMIRTPGTGEMTQEDDAPDGWVALGEEADRLSRVDSIGRFDNPVLEYATELTRLQLHYWNQDTGEL